MVYSLSIPKATRGYLLLVLDEDYTIVNISPVTEEEWHMKSCNVESPWLNRQSVRWFLRCMAVNCCQGKRSFLKNFNVMFDDPFKQKGGQKPKKNPDGLKWKYADILWRQKWVCPNLWPKCSPPPIQAINKHMKSAQRQKGEEVLGVSVD